ncbi:hypothetical protein L3X38_035849 [Prunus dulcis]|uniref:Tryptophanyl-tRNA synthetase n=1 Tax=Prunus dulcis TaxID=3755 RepID=A0AAD4VKH9_PRUDU|nr:hypothetical protein L3X38_035849 [Prunus dulcis]
MPSEERKKRAAERGRGRRRAVLVDRIHRLTSRAPHVFLRRGVFFAHRDLNEILGIAFGSSYPLHVQLIFARGLKVPLVIQITDDEKCMWKNLTVEES